MFCLCAFESYWIENEIFLDGEDVVSIFPLQKNYQGWIDTLHGGIQATLLDEICAWKLIHMLGTSGVTSKMEVRYRRPIMTTWPYILIRAELVEQRRNIVVMKATITSPDGELCSYAECIYYSFPPEKAREIGFAPCETLGEELTMEEAIRLTLE